MTEQGPRQLNDAPLGSAGRNRTLGLIALDTIQVPIPEFELRCCFDKIFQLVELPRQARIKALQELDAMLPAVLERAFREEL